MLTTCARARATTKKSELINSDRDKIPRGPMPASAPERISEEEFVRRLQKLISEGKFSANTTYSAEEVAEQVGCTSFFVKRFLPIIVAARDIPGKIHWEGRQVGKAMRYGFRVTNDLAP